MWNHVPGSINPADMLTRGVADPLHLLEPTKTGTHWFTGPAFLLQDIDSWPAATIPDLNYDDEEIKKRASFVCLNSVHVQRSLIDVYRYSSWPRLKRIAAWCLRWIHNVNAAKKGVPRRSDEHPSCDELKSAEVFILKDTQATALQDDLHAIHSKGVVPESSKLSSLSPFLDSVGLLRVGGRLKNAPIPFISKHPCILPYNHHVTRIIISHEHVSNGHVGQEHTLAILRSSYWIINGRTAIKSVIRNCFFCKIRRAMRMYPYMADLPVYRTAYNEPPYNNCGVDLFGPILVKQGRKRLKRWGVLFTCLTVRCIHLEIVESMETDTFINAFRRFTNRRGCPTTMYSDCGMNFKGATTELKEFSSGLNKVAISKAAADMNIHWDFNPPESPHMGGAWERLVRSVKPCVH